MNDAKDVDDDSDEDNDENMDVVSAGSDQDMVDELEEEKRNQSFEPVRAVINDRGDIYYVTNYEGQCTIWEIDSR